ncbi:MAG: AMP-binding protein, partial [Pseudomonadota bacterium]
LIGTTASPAHQIPKSAKLHGAEAGWILSDAGARLCFASEKSAAALSGHEPVTIERVVRFGSTAYETLASTEPLPHPATDPGSGATTLAWLFYTSGTTGKPKGAMLSNASLGLMALSYLAEVDPTVLGDCQVHGAPLSHGSGMYLIAAVAAGAVNVIPESGGFEPGEVFRLAEHWRRSSMFAAPTMIRRLTAAGEPMDPSAFRRLVYGGGPMYVADAVEALDRFGPCLAQIYGQGEYPMSLTTLTAYEIAARDHPAWQDRLASVGRAFLAADVAVLRQDGSAAAPGEVGEICGRGPMQMLGYWANEQATAKTLRDGWLWTGDLGAMDEAGYVTLKDRSKDLVITGGTNVYPREVEEVLLTHDAVAEVAVIGRPDPEWGESLVAYVVGAATAEALERHCLDRIARFKRPKAYRFVEGLPKNNYGKVLKTTLRDWEAEAEH